MEEYVLASNEIVLYEGECFYLSDLKTKCKIILTNLNVVLESLKRKLFKTEIEEIKTYKVTNVKIYLNEPQIKLNDTTIVFYFTNEIVSLFFGDKKEAKKFYSKIMELATGKTGLKRGLEKVVGAVDDTLGIDSVGTVENAFSKSKLGGIFGFVKKKEKKDEVAVSGNFDNSSVGVKNDDFDSRVEKLKKLKELLDQGVLTQEEFAEQKKAIMQS